MADDRDTRTFIIPAPARLAPASLAECISSIPDLVSYLRKRHQFRWVAEAFAHYYQNGGDLDEHLGLKPRQGGRHETVPAVKRKEKLRDLLKQLLATISGTPSVRLEAIGALLRGDVQPRDDQTALVQSLRELRCPASRSQLTRLVRQIEGISAIDPGRV